MTLLPAALGGSGDVVVWRLDRAKHAPTWTSGEGAYRGGGRWNSKGVRAVYCSLDSSTATLEVAVHKGFDVLDADPHVLIHATLRDPSGVHVVKADDVPNPNWLRAGAPSPNQQRFGDDLLGRHPVVMIPSVVSMHSWNVILTDVAAAQLVDVVHERFALDTRLVKLA